MSTVRRASIALLALLLVGCGASTASTQGASGEPAGSTPATSAPTEAQPSPSPSTCADFDMAAAHLSTYWHYLKINLGTDNDEAPTIADMTQAMETLTALAPKCAPKAVKALTKLATTSAVVASTYQTKPDAMQAAAVDEAMAAMQEQGVAAWTAMGISTYAWE